MSMVLVRTLEWCIVRCRPEKTPQRASPSSTSSRTFTQGGVATRWAEFALRSVYGDVLCVCSLQSETGGLMKNLRESTSNVKVINSILTQ